MTGAQRLRAVGSGSVPSSILRVTGSYPLAVLTVVDCRLTLRLRWFARMFGAETLDVGPDDLTLVYPLRSKRNVSIRGIGFRTPDKRDWYFFTPPVRDILEALRTCGYPVTDQPELASKLWRGVA